MTSLKNNILYSIGYQILIMILPLITAPYISRVLGVQGIGEYSYTYSIACYFTLIAMLGISQYGNRSIAEVGENKYLISKRFFNIYRIQVFTHIIAIIIYLIYLVFFSKNDMLLSSIHIIYIFSSLLDISWLFFGLEQFKITVIRNTIIKITTVTLIFIFVKQPSDIWKYALILNLGTLFSQLYLWAYLKKFVDYVPSPISEVKNDIKSILLLFIPVLAYSIYKVMDKIMLGYLSTYEQVGFYENAYKINNIPIGLITAIGNVMLPRMTSLVASNKKQESVKYIENSFYVINFIASALIFGIAGISQNFVVVYYGSEFSYCSSLIICLNWSVFFISWANIMRTQYLIPNKKDKIYIISTIMGAVVNLIINLLLINPLKSMGASIGTLLAEFSVMIFQLISIRKELPVVKYLFQSIPYFINGFFMMIITKIIGDYIGIGIIQLIIQIICGGLFYIINSIWISYIRKDLIYSFWNKLVLSIRRRNL